MALDFQTAFGHYLRILRERRGLSLDKVEMLSQTFSERVEKGNLSRCENGKQRLGLSRLIPLSRIYKVPADAVVERMELDQELDRVGGPETDGLTLHELTWAGSQALRRDGLKWAAYAYFRDSLERVASDAPGHVADEDELRAYAVRNCGTAALKLGRARFALHEFLHVEAAVDSSSPTHPAILERIASAHHVLGDTPRARTAAERAVAAASAQNDLRVLAYAYSTLGSATATPDPRFAADCYRKALRAFRRTTERGDIDASLEKDSFEARTLINLGFCHIELGNRRAARRALLACVSASERHKLKREVALADILLGRLDEAEGQPERAARRWRKSLDTAKKVDDKILRFQAQFYLFRQAVTLGNAPAARARERQLRRLAAWMPDNVDEADEFRRIVAENDSLFLKG